MGRTSLESRKQPGGIQTFLDARVTCGEVFFVDSTNANAADSVGAGKNSDKPFATIAYAITQCTASKGDIIYVLPGHAETIAAAGSLALSKIGVSIIGLGQGANRPTITFNGTDSVIAISAASCRIQNVILAAGIDEVVKAISITASFAHLDRVDIHEVTSKQFIQFVLTDANADNMTIENCRHYQATAPAANSLWIQLVGADRARILNNEFFLTTTNSASSSVIESDTTAPLGILIKNNTIVQLGGTATIPIKLVANTSGYIDGNRVASAKTAIAGSIAAASCYCGQNYAGHVVNTSGLLEPVVDS
jgi:hypothetical protein